MYNSLYPIKSGTPIGIRANIADAHHTRHIFDGGIGMHGHNNIVPGFDKPLMQSPPNKAACTGQ